MIFCSVVGYVVHPFPLAPRIVSAHVTTTFCSATRTQASSTYVCPEESARQGYKLDGRHFSLGCVHVWYVRRPPRVHAMCQGQPFMVTIWWHKRKNRPRYFVGILLKIRPQPPVFNLVGFHQRFFGNQQRSGSIKARDAQRPFDDAGLNGQSSRPYVFLGNIRVVC